MHFLYFSVRNFLVDTKKQTKRNQTQQPTLLPFQPGSLEEEPGEKLPDEKKTPKNRFGVFFTVSCKGRHTIAWPQHSNSLCSCYFGRGQSITLWCWLNLARNTRAHHKCTVPPSWQQQHPTDTCHSDGPGSYMAYEEKPLMSTREKIKITRTEEA